ncbi:MAG: alpha/beta hydrolase [Spirochaetales bacterium]|uniref:Alpha/beta hydrolase n=1 Tax=Candidatus Thalassospirochaeta sargassi TaxID=3119039 RepID=A0AAJ1IFT3_9SPIO|nr:alpha/beta hydrolase [Spirochaetales bacterium]
MTAIILYAGKMLIPESTEVSEMILESQQKPPAPGTVHLDLKYRGILHPDAQLDIYAPLKIYTPGEAPLVVFFHGGSWVHGDKITIRIIDRFLNRLRENGYFVAAVNYRCSVFSGLKGPVKNGQAAVKWLIKNADNYGFDKENIGLYGVSAGGHIALMTETEFRNQHCISLVLAECAPTDINAMADGEAFASSDLLNKFPARYLSRYSPVNYTSTDMAPVLIYHGDADKIVHVNQAYRLNDAITNAGGYAELEIYEQGTHAFLDMSDELWYEQETRALVFMEKFFY